MELTQKQKEEIFQACAEQVLFELNGDEMYDALGEGEIIRRRLDTISDALRPQLGDGLDDDDADDLISEVTQEVVGDFQFKLHKFLKGVRPD